MSKTAIRHTSRRTTMVPVTTMEEVPVLSEDERADLLASLNDAQADIALGNFREFKPGELKTWLRKSLEDARLRQKNGT